MPSKTLVFGASLKPERISNKIIHRLANYGEDVFAFGLKKGTVSDVEIITDLILIEGLDTISLYIGPQRQRDYYDYLISLNPGRIIFNPGTENPEFYTLLKESNIEYEVACSMVLVATNQY
ncbi:MAG: CoA-binding protein [Bacteroidia bacterium]|nr:CoA-binding protein [Bacteroidia bacterium]